MSQLLPIGRPLPLSGPAQKLAAVRIWCHCRITFPVTVRALLREETLEAILAATRMGARTEDPTVRRPLRLRVEAAGAEE